MPKTNKVEDRVGRAPRGAWLLMYLSVSLTRCVCVCVSESVSFVLLSARFDIKSRRKQNETRQKFTQKFYRAWQGTNSSSFLVFYIILIEL